MLEDIVNRKLTNRNNQENDNENFYLNFGFIAYIIFIERYAKDVALGNFKHTKH